MSYADIADEFGISDTRVRQICHDTRVREQRGPGDIPAIKRVDVQCRQIGLECPLSMHGNGKETYNK